MNPTHIRQYTQPYLNTYIEEDIVEELSWVNSVISAYENSPGSILKDIENKKDAMILKYKTNKRITIPKKNTTNKNVIILSYDKKKFNEIVTEEKSNGLLGVVCRNILLMTFEKIKKIRINDILSDSLKNDVRALQQAICNLKNRYSIKIVCHESKIK